PPELVIEWIRDRDWNKHHQSLADAHLHRRNANRDNRDEYHQRRNLFIERRQEQQQAGERDAQDRVLERERASLMTYEERDTEQAYGGQQEFAAAQDHERCVHVDVAIKQTRAGEQGDAVAVARKDRLP